MAALVGSAEGQAHGKASPRGLWQDSRNEARTTTPSVRAEPRSLAWRTASRVSSQFHKSIAGHNEGSRDQQSMSRLRELKAAAGQSETDTEPKTKEEGAADSLARWQSQTTSQANLNQQAENEQEDGGSLR